MERAKEEGQQNNNNNNLQPTTTASTNNDQAQQQQVFYQNKKIESLLESKWISIKDGETKTLQFLADKTLVVDKKDFNGKPVTKVQFSVIDVNDERRQEKFFELSRLHVKKIYEELKAGKSILEISRSGSGKETRYFVKAVR